jgi:tRNA nucleotidyltransferase/poly(A) polymerase
MIQNKILDSLKQINVSFLKTIDSLKIQNQIEYLTYKIDTQNSIVAEVNSFYDSAWIKLILLISILGIIVPLIFQYFQRKDFKYLTENMNEKFDSKLENLKKSNELRIDLLLKKHKKKIKQLENNNKNVFLEIEANTYLSQSRSLYNEKDYPNALISSLKSAVYFKRCGRTERVDKNLYNVIISLKHIKKTQFKAIEESLSDSFNNKNFEQCLFELEEGLSYESPYANKIKEIRECITEIKSI